MKTAKAIRRHRQSRHRVFLMVFITIVIVVFYFLAQYLWEWSWLTESMATVLAIVAAVAFWLEYHENKMLNEAQFIMELNQQFIGDSNLSDVEWELEKYCNRCGKVSNTDDYDTAFREKFDLKNRDRQHLVNYLVHLEGIAALINNGVIHLDAIDDLMSYRYFVAVNNPLVQEMELLAYPDYYKGCFNIYKDWVNELKQQGVKIPMYVEGNDLVDKLKKQED